MKRIRFFFQKFLLGKSREQIELDALIKRGLTIGKNSHINAGFSIDGAWPWLISIGDNVTISTHVTILAHDASTNLVGCGTKLGLVTIGNNVFIGTRVTIVCNVRIGDNVIVGANSLVTQDLPEDGVYAGVPAKRICSIEEYREKHLRNRQNCPDLSTIRPWNQWQNASDEEKGQMVSKLKNGIGYI